MRVSVNKALAHSSFWLATLVMAVMGWTLYVAGVREAASAKQVSHTQDVRAQVAKVSDLARRAEEAQRGYLFSGGLDFLGQREEAFKGMGEALAAVRELTVGSRSQQLRVSQLEKLIAMRVARMQFDGHMRRAVGDEANAKIRELITELRREELRLQKEYRDAAENRHAVENRALLSGVVFGLIVLVPGYLGFVLQSRARRQTEDMLRVMADSLPGAMYQLKHNAKGHSRLTFMGPASPGSAESKRRAPRAAFPTGRSWSTTSTNGTGASSKPPWPARFAHSTPFASVTGSGIRTARCGASITRLPC